MSKLRISKIVSPSFSKSLLERNISRPFHPLNETLSKSSSMSSNTKHYIPRNCQFIKIPKSRTERRMEGGDKRWSDQMLDKIPRIPRKGQSFPSIPLSFSLSSSLVEIPRCFGAAKRASSPLVVESRRAGSDSRTVSRGWETKKHLDDCVRGTGVRRGCVHGLTIGNQTPFNAPSRCNPWCVYVCMRVCVWAQPFSN